MDRRELSSAQSVENRLKARNSKQELARTIRQTHQILESIGTDCTKEELSKAVYIIQRAVNAAMNR